MSRRLPAHLRIQSLIRRHITAQPHMSFTVIKKYRHYDAEQKQQAQQPEQSFSSSAAAAAAAAATAAAPQASGKAGKLGMARLLCLRLDVHADSLAWLAPT